jgi:hypothetical protein
MATHPPCGLYRTTVALEGIPPGRLVYFHNHGNPGAGVYLPSGWRTNRADWHSHGQTVPGPDWSQTLEALPAEGLYRVKEAFFCCEKKCREYGAEMLVQLGYNAEAEAILFVPQWSGGALSFPERGTRIEKGNFSRLSLLSVAQAPAEPAALPGGLLH